MEQGPQDPDATRAYQGAPDTYPPTYAAGPAPGPTGVYGPPPGPGYGNPYGYPYPPLRRPTNTLAILALVFAFVFAPAAIVMGAVARRQIRRTGEEGWGLATAGLIVGIVFTVLSLIWIIAVVTFLATTVHDVRQNQINGGGALVFARAWLGI